MARTEQEIATLIDNQIKEEPAIYNAGNPDSEGYINPDNPASATAIWAAFKNAFKRAQLKLELMWDSYLLELDLKAAQAKVALPAWYADRALEFQYGDLLTISDGAVVYPVIDVTKRIVKYAAITEVNGIVLIKVAKDNAGDYVKLEAGTELVAFKSYISSIKPAGILTRVISTDPDLVWCKLSIRYDGKIILADLKTAVESAIKGYLKGIYFDGYFNLNKFRDALESVAGIVPGGVNIQFVKIKPNGGTYVVVDWDYQPTSGYYALDPDKPLDNVAQVTYTAV